METAKENLNLEKIRITELKAAWNDLVTHFNAIREQSSYDPSEYIEVVKKYIGLYIERVRHCLDGAPSLKKLMDTLSEYQSPYILKQILSKGPSGVLLSVKLQAKQHTKKKINAKDINQLFKNA